MNEFSNRLGLIAQGVSRDFEATATDDSAALIRRAKRGRVVWTGAVGGATLATAAAVALGGSAAASSVFGSEAIQPATHSKPPSDDVTKAVPVPQDWSKVDKLSADAAAAKLAAEERAAAKKAAEKAAAEKAAKDKKDKAAKKAAKDKAKKDKSKKHHSKKGDPSKSGNKDKNCGDGSGKDGTKDKSGWKDKKDKDKGSESGDDNGGATEG